MHPLALRDSAATQTDELMPIHCRVTCHRGTLRACVSHHPLVVLPVDGDRFLLDDGVGDLMEVTEHVPAVVLLLLLAALLLFINFALLGLAFFSGDYAWLSGRGAQGASFRKRR